MPEFHFMESEWGLHAQRGGKITTGAALVFMVLSFVYVRLLGAFWSMAVALFLAAFEAPFLYKWLEPCRRLEDILNENIKFSIPIVRAGVDTGLAVVCFVIGGLFQILLGILLLMTAVLYIFAQIVGASLTDVSNEPASEAPADGQTPFGTFT